MPPTDTRTERNLMPEIEFFVGSHANNSASTLAELANQHNDVYWAYFNGVRMTAIPGDEPLHVIEAWQKEQDRRSEAYHNSPEGKRAAKEAEDRKKACQAAVDKLMQKFEALDFSNLDELVQFLDDLSEPGDHVNVSFDRQRIVDTFAQHGFERNVNIGDAFNANDRENVARYLIGQALNFLHMFGTIHPVFSFMAADWRKKFASV